MARNAEVNVTFQGDDSDLQRTFDNVGSGARDMASDVDKSASKADNALSTMGDRADGAESKFTGLGDTISGVGDISTAFAEGDIAGMAMGFASLAGGISSFVIPALTAMKTALLTGLAPALTAISAHPLIAGILIGGAIIAGLILLEKRFGVVSTAIGFVKDAADGLLGALGAVIRAFRDLWNETVGGKGFSFGGVDLPGPLDIPGFTLRIPRLHTGGMFSGPGGGEGLALLQSGERVIPRGASGPAGITVNVSGVGMGRDFGRAVADALRQNALLGVT